MGRNKRARKGMNKADGRDGSSTKGTPSLRMSASPEQDAQPGLGATSDQRRTTRARLTAARQDAMTAPDVPNA